MIEVSGVRRSFGTGATATEALRGVDLRAAPGAIVALFGRSGSGKTTLLNLVGGLDRPDVGTIDVGGVQVDQLDPEGAATWRRSNLGIVHQSHGLLPWLTTQDNVELPLRLLRMRRPERRERARARLAALGLADRVAHLPDELSGGQQRRVAIARALVTEARVLLADEPTAGLDEDTARVVFGLLRDEAHETGRTVLLTSHDPLAREVADEVIELRDGRRLED
ncbi:MAG: ABC transporter ATP-binding protein [Actinomycetota bacterium]